MNEKWRWMRMVQGLGPLLCMVGCNAIGGIDEGVPRDGGITGNGNSCSPTCNKQKVLQVTVGSFYSCALLNDGVAKCWGSNENGQLGLGDTEDRGDEPGEMGDSLPTVDLGTGQTAKAVVAGFSYACALLSDGAVKCWGRNDYGQLGLGDTQTRGDSPGEMGESLYAVNLGIGQTAKAIAAGARHNCALLNGGAVKCWGYNAHGELGLGDTHDRGDSPGGMGDSLPTVDLGTGKTAKTIVAGAWHTCALLNDSAVKCWGYNGYGELGLGDSQSRGDEPGEMGDSLPVVDLGVSKTATAIAAGAWHTCALLNDGAVKCWGYNDHGELGLGNTQWYGDDLGEMGNSLPAVDLGMGKTAKAIASGSEHTCALLSGGSIKCWGSNSSGRLGIGNTKWHGDSSGAMGDSLPVVELGVGKAAKTVVAGGGHTCALLYDDSVKCWGYNRDGQLGLGETQNRGDEPNEMGDKLPTVNLFSNPL